MPVNVPTFTHEPTGTVLPNAYLEVRDVRVLEEKQRIHVVVDVYASAAAKAAGRKPITTLDHTFGGAAYTQLKNLITDRAEQRLLTIYPGSTQI